MVSPIPMMLLFGSWAYPALRPPRRFGQHEVSSHMVSFFSFPLSPTFVIFLSPGCVFADDVPLFFFFLTPGFVRRVRCFSPSFSTSVVLAVPFFRSFP